MEQKARQSYEKTNSLSSNRLWNERIEKGRFILLQVDWISRLESGETVETERTPLQAEFKF